MFPVEQLSWNFFGKRFRRARQGAPREAENPLKQQKLAQKGSFSHRRSSKEKRRETTEKVLIKSSDFAAPNCVRRGQ